MTSNETNVESNKYYDKVRSAIDERNKIIKHKEVSFPCIHTEDTDLSDVLEECNIPKKSPHKSLQDNEQSIRTFVENIRKLKCDSGLEMDFVINEDKNISDPSIYNVVSSLRQQSEKLFKRIINTQVGFNEYLNSDLMKNNLEVKDHIKNHKELIKQTCQINRGVESILNCEKHVLEDHIEKDFTVKNMNDYKNGCDKLTQGVLSTFYEAGVKSAKNHEHLLAIEKYNKHTKDLNVEEVISNKIDPYSRQPITKPVLNNVCKHIYDQDSIDQMFQGKLFIHCPFIGCKNKHVTKKDLSYDNIK